MAAPGYIECPWCKSQFDTPDGFYSYGQSKKWKCPECDCSSYALEWDWVIAWDEDAGDYEWEYRSFMEARAVRAEWWEHVETHWRLDFNECRNGDLTFVTSKKHIPSQEEWELIKSKVDEFYNTVREDEIVHYNHLVDASAEYRRQIDAIINDTKKKFGQKRSGVYLIKKTDESFKIGRSVDIAKRLYQHIREQKCLLEVLHVIDAENLEAAEAFFHNQFSDKRIGGEWFRLSDDDVQWFMSVQSWPVE